MAATTAHDDDDDDDDDGDDDDDDDDDDDTNHEKSSHSPVPLHYGFRWPIRFWNVGKVPKSTLLFDHFYPHNPKNNCSDSGMTQILCQKLLDTFSQ